MPLFGKVVVIRRNGSDGSQFPVTSTSCVFGKSTDCDVRVQLPYVSDQQCKISLDENGKFILHNLSQTNETILNGKPVTEPMTVGHKDMFTIVDRSFRFEYPEAAKEIAKTPQKSQVKQNTPQRKPLGERKTSLNVQSESESPFSQLVSDMKQSIKMKPAAKKEPKKSCSPKQNTSNVNAESVPSRRSPRTSLSNVTVSAEKASKNEDVSFQPRDDLQNVHADGESSQPNVGTPTHVIAKLSIEADVQTTPKHSGVTAATEKSISESPAFDTDGHSSTKQTESDVPVISLTPDQASGEPGKDPYDFPEARKSSQKKFRRKSFGATSVSHKQALLLFGSPRTPSTTSLRKSMGEIRRKSIPLVERETEEEMTASPVTKKNWDPLPAVDEVENNSSPVKKPKGALHLAARPSPLLFDEPNRSTRRKSSRVSFGPQLSPEQFLNHLPPNTPIKKGAAPTSTVKTTGRKSLAALGTTSLSTVQESTPEMPKRSKTTPVSKATVARTPTPYKLGSSKKKPKSLLHNVLNAAFDKHAHEPSMEGSPILATKEKRERRSLQQLQKRKSEDAVGEERTKKTTPIVVKQNASSTSSSKKIVTQQRRRSSGRFKAKPLWSDIVKRAPVVQSTKSTSSSNVAVMTKKKRIATKQQKLSQLAEGHHIDSPATLYIGKAQRRTQPTRTPRPPRLAAPTKLDLPADESFTGMSEMFQTPKAATPHGTDINKSLQSDLKTPDTVGSMFVSPMSVTTSRKTARRSEQSTPLDVGASPQLSVTRKRLSSGRKDDRAGDDSASSSMEAVEKDLEPQKKRQKNLPVDENFGMKRLLKTPKEKGKAKSVDTKLGTKRLLKTPKDKQKTKPVEEHFGTKRLLKTPKDSKKSTPVEDKLGTKRLLTTPKQKAKYQPVEEKFGMKRLLKTPRNKQKEEPVTDKFGTKRLLTTPKEKVKSQPAVEKKLGLKRLLTTPKVKSKAQPVEDKFGTKRLLTTPKTKVKAGPVEKYFGTKRLLKTPEEKCKGQAVEDDFGTERLFASPKDHAAAVEAHFETEPVSLVSTSKAEVAATEPVTNIVRLDKVVATPDGQRPDQTTAEVTCEEEEKTPAKKKRGKAAAKQPKKSTKAIVSTKGDAAEQEKATDDKVEESVAVSDMSEKSTVPPAVEQSDLGNNVTRGTTRKTTRSSRKTRQAAGTTNQDISVEQEPAQVSVETGGDVKETRSKGKKAVSFHPTVIGGRTPVATKGKARKTVTKAQPKSRRNRQAQELLQPSVEDETSVPAESTASVESIESGVSKSEVESSEQDLTAAKRPSSRKRTRKEAADPVEPAPRSVRSRGRKPVEAVNVEPTQTKVESTGKEEEGAVDSLVTEKVAENQNEKDEPEALPPKRSRRAGAAKPVAKQGTRVRSRATRNKTEVKASDVQDVEERKDVDKSSDVKKAVVKTLPTKRTRRAATTESCTKEEATNEDIKKTEEKDGKIKAVEETLPAKRSRRAATAESRTKQETKPKPRSSRSKAKVAKSDDTAEVVTEEVKKAEEKETKVEAVVETLPAKRSRRAATAESHTKQVEKPEPKSTRRRGKAAEEKAPAKANDDKEQADSDDKPEKVVKKKAAKRSTRGAATKTASKPETKPKAAKAKAAEPQAEVDEPGIRRSSRRK